MSIKPISLGVGGVTAAGIENGCHSIEKFIYSRFMTSLKDLIDCYI